MRYSPFRHIDSIFLKRRPIQLTLFLTRRCNSRCSFCFYLSDSNRMEQGGKELSLDEIRKISSSMGSLLWLAFSGGEIFLRDDIVEITRAFYDKNRPAMILFPTNGLLTDTISERIERILQYCKKSSIVVKLSLDGAGELHDSIRGKEGSYRSTMRTYDALGALLDTYPNFELGMNTVFCRENQDRMEEVLDHVKGLGRIKTHTVSLIRETGGYKGEQDVDIEKYKYIIDKMAVNLKEKKSAIYRFKGSKLKAAQDILQRRLIYETCTRKRQLIPCYAGRLNIVISESGDVYPCESFTMKMGSLRDNGYDVEGLLKTPAARDIIRSIRDEGCFCTHECYLMTNIFFNPAVYPSLIKEYMRL